MCLPSQYVSEYFRSRTFGSSFSLILLAAGKNTHLVTQWAAVNTHWVPIRAPPHRYWLSELMSATCQHHSTASASSPPTTLELRVLDVPLTPHTYLLYVDGLDGIGLDVVVSVDTVGFAG